MSSEIWCTTDFVLNVQEKEVAMVNKTLQRQNKVVLVYGKPNMTGAKPVAFA